MRKERSLFGWLGVLFRGVAMGAADVIPGVSGGTIAFITGIYEELIHSLGNLNFSALGVLRKEGISRFWRFINGNFFVALFLGILISVFSLAKLVTFLLATYPVLLWSFFFGLVLASAFLIIKSIKSWNTLTLIGLIVGTTCAAYISSLQTVASGGESWYIFMSGAIAICAMILPGISGAFILVLLGSYHIVIEGIKDVNLTIIILFGLGCAVGLLLFSKLLKFFFERFKPLVLAVLSGFLLGSLVKIWPWKNEVGEAPIIVHSDGREEWMLANVLPEHFNGDAHLIGAGITMLVGFAVVLILGFIAPSDEQ